MLDDDLVFSLTASSEPSICAVTGLAIQEQPLPVPDDGVLVWELQGGQQVSSLDIKLPEEHTLALWMKLLPARDREPGSLLAGADGAPWLSLGSGGTLQGSPLPADAAEQ